MTGGAGFIGSHLVDALVERGLRVRVLDNFSSGKEGFLSHHEGSGMVENLRGANIFSGGFPYITCREISSVVPCTGEIYLVSP